MALLATPLADQDLLTTQQLDPLLTIPSSITELKKPKYPKIEKPKPPAKKNDLQEPINTPFQPFSMEQPNTIPIPRPPRPQSAPPVSKLSPPPNYSSDLYTSYSNLYPSAMSTPETYDYYSAPSYTGSGVADSSHSGDFDDDDDDEDDDDGSAGATELNETSYADDQDYYGYGDEDDTTDLHYSSSNLYPRQQAYGGGLAFGGARARARGDRKRRTAVAPIRIRRHPNAPSLPLWPERLDRMRTMSHSLNVPKKKITALVKKYRARKGTEDHMSRKELAKRFRRQQMFQCHTTEPFKTLAYTAPGPKSARLESFVQKCAEASNASYIDKPSRPLNSYALFIKENKNQLNEVFKTMPVEKRRGGAFGKYVGLAYHWYQEHGTVPTSETLQTFLPVNTGVSVATPATITPAVVTEEDIDIVN